MVKTTNMAKQSSVKQLHSMGGWQSTPIRKPSSTIETFLVVGLIILRLVALALGVVRNTMRKVPPPVSRSHAEFGELTNTEVHKVTDHCQDNLLHISPRERGQEILRYRGSYSTNCQDLVFSRICRLLYARLACLHYIIRVGPDHI